MQYIDLRKEWISLRKSKEDERKMKLLGLIIDKTLKFAKEDNSDNYDKYVMKAIKSEYKQQLDSLKQGVDSEYEISLLEEKLPKTKSKEETEEIIEKLLLEYESFMHTPDMGSLMKDLRGFNDIDLKMASKLVKEKLSNN